MYGVHVILCACTDDAVVDVIKCVQATWPVLGEHHRTPHGHGLHRSTGHNLPGIASQFATQNPGFAMHCCTCVAKDEACMLHSRVIA